MPAVYSCWSYGRLILHVGDLQAFKIAATQMLPVQRLSPRPPDRCPVCTICTHTCCRHSIDWSMTLWQPAPREDLVTPNSHPCSKLAAVAHKRSMCLCLAAVKWEMPRVTEAEFYKIQECSAVIYGTWTSVGGIQHSIKWDTTETQCTLSAVTAVCDIHRTSSKSPKSKKARVGWRFHSPYGFIETQHPFVHKN